MTDAALSTNAAMTETQSPLFSFGETKREATPQSHQRPTEPVIALQHDDSHLVMDRGVMAWLQVLGSWLLFANTWGLANSFGVFQTYYTDTLLRDTSPSIIAWIGSVQIFLMMLIGVLAGWLIDAGHLQFILMTGTLMTAVGMFLLSLCTTYWQILLSQGVCVGIGSGLLGLTSVAVIPLWFEKRRMVATGIAATGSSLTGILYPIMERRLFVSVGFPWAVRALAFIVSACLGLCIFLLRLRPNVRRRGPLFELRHFKDAPYAFFCLAFALMIASVYVPFFFIESYGISLGVDADMAFYLLSIMNAASLVGRVVPNWLADKYGGMVVMIPCCAFSCLVLFLMRFAYSTPGLIVVSLVYGFVSGGMVALPPATIANLTRNRSEYGTRMGMGYTIASIGALIGNPIGGAAQRGPGQTHSRADVQSEYQGTWIFAGSFMLAATILIIVAKRLA